MIDSAVRLRGVTKSFGELSVLAGIDLDVARGETTVILGRSGSGKSVLLKVIAGLLTPEEGSVSVLGIDPFRGDPAARLEVRRRMGFLFQSGALFDSMTIAENIAFPLVEDGRDGREIARIVRERLSDVGLAASVGEKNPSELSGGMRKRAALARALARSPEILLHDEPTTGLDPIGCAAVAQLLDETRKRLGVTQIVVTHEIPLALRVADRLHLLYNGRITAQGTPAEFAEPTDPLVRQFVRGELEGPMEVEATS